MDENRDGRGSRVIGKVVDGVCVNVVK